MRSLALTAHSLKRGGMNGFEHQVQQVTAAQTLHVWTGPVRIDLQSRQLFKHMSRQFVFGQGH